jgi:hypothetical protein
MSNFLPSKIFTLKLFTTRKQYHITDTGAPTGLTIEHRGNTLVVPPTIIDAVGQHESGF